mmetsp:Transcript_13170/g.24148  ORF Transcript_13170/g.24148 Transcript_13170/m.24148 type:complete len:213 (+) Transcript_13170:10466-11104(+)
MKVPTGQGSHSEGELAPLLSVDFPTSHAIHSVAPLPDHFPSEQRAQALSLVAAELPPANFPAAHSTHLSDPAEENEPLGHDWHLSIVEDPTIVEYFPALQLVHTALPTLPFHFPAGQSAQRSMLLAPVSALKVPVGQLRQDVAPALEYVPTPQSWQLDCPAAACFFPAGHTRQLSLDELAEVYFPLWQAVQSETEVPPVFGLNFPAPQFVQD